MAEPPTPLADGARPWWVRPDGTVIPPSPLSTSRLFAERARKSSTGSVSGALRRAAAAAAEYEAGRRG